MLGWAAAGFGVLLALIGGLIARPRYLWAGLIAIGFICVLSFGMYFNLPRNRPLQPSYLTDVALSFVSMLPTNILLTLQGEACTIEGLVIRLTKRKKAQV